MNYNVKRDLIAGKKESLTIKLKNYKLNSKLKERFMRKLEITLKEERPK